MKYAKEIIELLSPYPERDFRMAHIVRYINPNTTKLERDCIREGVSVVLFALVDCGSVKMTPPAKRGSFALYRWKVQDEVKQSESESVRLTPG